MNKQKQNGFSIVELLLVVIVLAGLAGLGRYAWQRKGTNSKTASYAAGEGTKLDSASKDVRWSFDQKNNIWSPSSTPPTCSKPELTQSPVDVNLATRILMPGQYRGFNYKPHGGFGFENNANNEITVKMPLDARITGMVRYIEAGEVQYLASFENACGISYRFDHLFTLSPVFQKIADTTPAPTESTASLPLKNQPSFKVGTVVATAIGHPATNNRGMDFGVYDYRKQNEISKNAQWKALHSNYTASEWYGVCWFDMLPAAASVRIHTLVGQHEAENVARAVSDYCPTKGGNTLQYNNGKPTNG